MPPTVKISSAEGSKDLADAKGFENAECCYLPNADIEFTGYLPFQGRALGAFGVEIKSIGDFLTSVGDKRLTAFDGQLTRMAMTYPRSFLLVYGKYKFVGGGQSIRTKSYTYQGYSRRRFGNTVRSIEAAGVLCDFVGDKTDAVPWILETIDWHQNPNHRTFFSTQERKKPDPVKIPELCARAGYRLPSTVQRALKSKETQLFVNLVCQLPTVSVVKAVRLMERFGSVVGLVMASERELREVEGIGPDGARRIHQFLQQDVLKG